MKTTAILNSGDSQSIVLPKEFQIAGDHVTIRREGESIILTPIKASKWPEGFFESICITDPAFVRPSQGELPPAPNFNDSQG